MEKEQKNVSLSFQKCENVPHNVTEVIVETTPDADEEMEEVEVYEYEDTEEVPIFRTTTEKKPVTNQKPSHIRKRLRRLEDIKNHIASQEIDVVQLGRTVIIGAADGSLNASGLEKASKSQHANVGFLGDISMSALVTGLMSPDAADARYAMIGSSIMWNTLKTDVRETKNDIMMQTAQSKGQPKFDTLDLHMSNLRKRVHYTVEPTGVFSVADLQYIFSQLTFRGSAKLLNKTKQFLKAYFIVACRPRCMIWRYTLRRSGSSHKKAILNLPQTVVQSLLDILLDLTGIGDGHKPFRQIDPSSPFYLRLGNDYSVREERYMEMIQLKDPLCNFFRDAMTDCLNEIREMPFCTKTGLIISPLRGRPLGRFCVTWKQYESLLKKEHDFPNEMNMRMRVQFEQKVCDVVVHG